MAEDDRIVSLQAEHAALEEALEKENDRPHPDPILVADLKKQKLRIKDELAAFSTV